MKPLGILVVAMAVALAACTTGDEADGVVGGEAETAPSREMVTAEPEDGFKSVGVDVVGAGESEVPAVDEISSPQVRIIRDAGLQVRVDQGSFQQRWRELRLIAADLGGYVSDASTGVFEEGDDEFAFGTATVRVPAGRFDEAIDAFGALGEQVSFTMNTQDVSEEFVDLESRLRHWKATESFLLGLMEEAATIEEALRLQDELGEVQLTIEQIEGRLRYLESRTELSAVTVTLTEAPAELPPPEEPKEPSELAEALDSARQVIMGIFSFLIVAAAAVVPVALFALFAFGIWRLGRRIARPKEAAVQE